MSNFLLYTSIILAAVSSLVQIWGYVVYNSKAKIGDIKPNSSSWAIWTFGSVVNVLSYAFLTDDWVKDLLPTACALACLVTFVISLHRKQYGRPDLFGVVIFISDCLITVVWFFTSVVAANILYQISTVVSYMPMIIGINRGVDRENYVPWLIWSSAYLMFVISVFIRLNNWIEMIYPLISLALSVYITLISLRPKNNNC